MACARGARPRSRREWGVARRARARKPCNCKRGEICFACPFRSYFTRRLSGLSHSRPSLRFSPGLPISLHTCLMFVSLRVLVWAGPLRLPSRFGIIAALPRRCVVDPIPAGPTRRWPTAPCGWVCPLPVGPWRAHCLLIDGAPEQTTRCVCEVGQFCFLQGCRSTHCRRGRVRSAPASARRASP